MMEMLLRCYHKWRRLTCRLPMPLLLLLITFLSCCSLCCGDEDSDGDIMMMDSYMNSILEWKTELGTSPPVRIIPNHHYVSAFLNTGISKRFLYINQVPGNVLSILVTPCTSVLLWTVKYWPLNNHKPRSNFTIYRPHDQPELLKFFRTEKSATFYDLKSRRGIYTIDIKPLYGDSYVHLYAKNGAHPLRIPSNFVETSNINPGVPKPKISVRRLRGNRLHVKWEASAINPQHMKYCIVVNSQKDYSTLCGAQGTKFGVLPPDLMHVSYYYFPFQQQQQQRIREHDDDQINSDSRNDPHGTTFKMDDNRNDDDRDDGETKYSHNNIQHSRIDEDRHRHRHNGMSEASNSKSREKFSSSSSFEERERARDIIIGCIGRKTNYIINNLQEGKLYYFNVFIKDASTNLTYPYVRTTIKYQGPKNLPNGITDSKPRKVMVSGDGKPTLVKFNLKKPCSELSMYVMPCHHSGELTYQIIHAYKSIIERNQSDNLDIIKIAMPQHGRYYIRLRQSNTNTNTNANINGSPTQSNNSSSSHSSAIPPRMVEIYVSKRNKRFPLPKLPKNTQIIEDVRERSCDSVRILWHPSPEKRDNEYCIFLKEENRKRIFNFKKPNQCDIERSLNSDPYVTHSMCIQKTPKSPGHYLSQIIGGLEAGKVYIVQLIVRRHKGKSLSYDLLQVSTLRLYRPYIWLYLNFT